MAKVKDVWAINTDTRRLTAAVAYQRVYDLAGELKKAHFGRVYKKIDSTLRGHPGAELEAVMDAWEMEFALSARSDCRLVEVDTKAIVAGRADAEVQRVLGRGGGRKRPKGLDHHCCHQPFSSFPGRRRQQGAARAVAVVMSARDNVATALTNLAQGTEVELAKEDHHWRIVVDQDIAAGHKFAVEPVASSTPVRKYGEIIGTASQDIAPREHVHVHNVVGNRGRGDRVSVEVVKEGGTFSFDLQGLPPKQWTSRRA